jgi:hypothetical protein
MGGPSENGATAGSIRRATDEAGPGSSRWSWWPSQGSRRRALLLVGFTMIIGVWHVWAVSSRYFVGSFDDDASYLLTAQAILHGAGLTGHLTSGASVVGA